MLSVTHDRRALCELSREFCSRGCALTKVKCEFDILSDGLSLHRMMRVVSPSCASMTSRKGGILFLKFARLLRENFVMLFRSFEKDLSVVSPYMVSMLSRMCYCACYAQDVLLRWESMGSIEILSSYAGLRIEPF